MARVIRANNQNVSPSDDASLYRNIYDDGLFESATITSAGAALVNVSALYGIMEGRDFTTEAMQITVELPGSGTDTGSIVVRFDTTTDTVISIVSGLDYALTYEDINATGTICEMEIATYTASATAVTAITSTYNIINPHTLTECGDTIGSSTLTTTAQTLSGAINELDAEIGSATLTTTAQTLTGAINELNANFPLYIGESPSSGLSNNVTFDLSEYITVNGLYIIYGIASEVAIKLSGTTYTLIFFRYPTVISDSPSLSASSLTMYVGSYNWKCRIYRVN